MVQNILEVENLNVVFDNKKVIDGLSFTLKDKENLVIVGPNGAGKTVLLKSLLGIIPFQGRIKWNGDVKIGYVPQRFALEKNFPLSVEEFFRFKTSDLSDVHNALRLVGIDDLSVCKSRISALSSGQLQRILIAWSLIDNPNVLLFDEPTAGIDIGGEETIYNLLHKIEKERDLTIILITHDLNIVYKFADSVLCLNKKMICYGAPDKALNSAELERLYGGEVKFYKHEH